MRTLTRTRAHSQTHMHAHENQVENGGGGGGRAGRDEKVALKGGQKLATRLAHQVPERPLVQLHLLVVVVQAGSGAWVKA